MMSAVRIKVLYFARAREVAGKSEEVLALPSPLDTKLLREELLRRYPGMSGLLTSGTLAVNEEYVDGVQTLENNDVVAVIPPISGG
jgi:molybdopterin converting factor subunit 1